MGATHGIPPEGRDGVAAASRRRVIRAERDTKPHGGVRIPAVGGVRNAHVTHGKYDIDVRTAQRWQDPIVGATHGISARRAPHRREATSRRVRHKAAWRRKDPSRGLRAQRARNPRKKRY